MKKFLIILATVFLMTSNIFSIENIRSLTTFDINYARIGLMNNGWGFGACYEQIIIDHLSLKGSFGHMTFKTSVKDLYCTTVNITLISNYYPFNEDLNRFYIGTGCSTDFLNYFGSGTINDKEEDTIIYWDVVVGWKEYLARWLMVDINTGYNLIINNAENYPSFDKYGKAGLQASIIMKIFIKK